MKFHSKLVASILAGTVVLSNVFTFNVKAETKDLEVHFINVGQGDATYIELPNGDDILIDAGDVGYGQSVVNYLKNEENDIDIEYLIATHPDSDHIGGMKDVFTQLNVKNFYYPQDTSNSSNIWGQVLDLAKNEGCNIVDAKSGLKIGDSNVSIDFIQPEIDYSDNNDDSVVALVDYNDVEILLTGDISSKTEEDLINSGLIGDIEVLKVPHHGSKYSSSKEFLDTVGARNSIISVGKDNTYGHPTSEVLERLTASGSNIWRTDVNGNIVVSTDGNIIRISCDDKVEDNNKPAEDIKPGTWISENGKWYYYKNGVKQTGWVNDKGHWYYLSNTGEMKTGWYTVGSKWYYSNSSGVMQTGWLSDGGTWYYLNSSGEMSTGWYMVGSKWYYSSASGAMKTGWLDNNGRWYYLNSSGEMATGWLNDNGTWYYLRSSGEMAKGWYMVGSKWYYSSASGAMRTGWLNDNGTWYYLRSSGEMAKGWYIVGSKWYYSSASGAMRTGWLNDNGTWYYLRSSGEMATGWLNDNGTWYYLDSSGKMVTNAIIDNWQIDSNGVATPAINGGNNSGGSDNSSQDRTVYVTPSGKSYHYNDDCVTLKRSTTILSMSKSEAISKGKSDPCNLCVK